MSRNRKVLCILCVILFGSLLGCGTDDESVEEAGGIEINTIGLMSGSNAAQPSEDYFLVVKNVSRQSERDAPAGFVIITITAAVSNQSGPTASVSQDSIALLDVDGNDYRPFVDSTVSPSLLEQELQIATSIIGFASFYIPSEIVVDQMMWCPSGSIPCDEAAFAPITEQ